MNPSEFEGTLNWFQNPVSKVSAHWVIARDGRACCVVPNDFSAWHAQEHNVTHWGIELEQGVESDGFTTAQMGKLIKVCKGYVEDFGVPVAHDMRGFIGHQETPQGIRVGKSDPGKLFDWAALMAGLGAPTAPDKLLDLTFLVDVGYFITHDWDFKDMQPWQRAIIADWNRRANE